MVSRHERPRAPIPARRRMRRVRPAFSPLSRRSTPSTDAPASAATRTAEHDRHAGEPSAMPHADHSFWVDPDDMASVVRFLVSGAVGRHDGSRDTRVREPIRTEIAMAPAAADPDRLTTPRGRPSRDRAGRVAVLRLGPTSSAVDGDRRAARFARGERGGGLDRLGRAPAVGGAD